MLKQICAIEKLQLTVILANITRKDKTVINTRCCRYLSNPGGTGPKTQIQDQTSFSQFCQSPLSGTPWLTSDQRLDSTLLLLHPLGCSLLSWPSFSTGMQGDQLHAPPLCRLPGGLERHNTRDSGKGENTEQCDMIKQQYLKVQIEGSVGRQQSQHHHHHHHHSDDESWQRIGWNRNTADEKNDHHQIRLSTTKVKTHPVTSMFSLKCYYRSEEHTSALQSR